MACMVLCVGIGFVLPSLMFIIFCNDTVQCAESSSKRCVCWNCNGYKLET